MLFSQHARFGAEPLSADVRLAFWPKVVASIAEHPLAGAGFGRSVMHKAYPELIPADTPALWHAHNVFLNYGLQLGVPGMLALAGVFGSLAMLFWRAATNHAVAGLAGLMLVSGVLLRNQFNDFFTRDMSLMFWALAGLFVRLAVTAKQGTNSDQQTPA
jgi:O-antigen ligase